MLSTSSQASHSGSHSGSHPNRLSALYPPQKRHPNTPETIPEDEEEEEEDDDLKNAAHHSMSSSMMNEAKDEIVDINNYTPSTPDPAMNGPPQQFTRLSNAYASVTSPSLQMILCMDIFIHILYINMNVTI